MKQSIYKSLKTIAILFVPALFLLFASDIAKAQSGRFCGSVEKFNQTKRWQDLPGCTEEKDYSNPTSSAMLLSRAKGAFQNFFELWETGEIERAEKNSGGCLAFDYGAEQYWSSQSELVIARPAYDEMKRKVQQYVEWQPLVYDLAQRYIYAMTFLDEAKSGDMQSANIAVNDVKKLQNAIAVVQQKNVPDDFIVPGSGKVPASTIGEIKAKINEYLGQANDSKENAIAIDNAKWEPYTKLLTGDRLNFFNETYRAGDNVFGRGGTKLYSPEEFDTATVMCTRSWGRSGIVETWRVSCYTFRGDRKISGPRIKSGYGSSTPPSAFQ